MLGAGALGRPRGMVWGGRRKEGSGWGTQEDPRAVEQPSLRTTAAELLSRAQEL